MSKASYIFNVFLVYNTTTISFPMQISRFKCQKPRTFDKGNPNIKSAYVLVMTSPIYISGLTTTMKSSSGLTISEVKTVSSDASGVEPGARSLR